MSELELPLFAIIFSSLWKEGICERCGIKCNAFITGSLYGGFSVLIVHYNLHV